MCKIYLIFDVERHRWHRKQTTVMALLLQCTKSFRFDLFILLFFRSPGGTPMKKTKRGGNPTNAADIIAQALHDKFKHTKMTYDSPGKIPKEINVTFHLKNTFSKRVTSKFRYKMYLNFDVKRFENHSFSHET